MLPGVIVILIPLRGGPVRRRRMEIARRTWWVADRRPASILATATPHCRADHPQCRPPCHLVVAASTYVHDTCSRINRCLRLSWNYSSSPVTMVWHTDLQNAVFSLFPLVTHQYAITLQYQAMHAW